ncbi:heterokaryon incompatibility protein-domain-containing protein [Paraphoma chrysanthemicola]|nr:heterokaryon incompatibility protein-domain-containing protein [Paraphoma chrysanthemicola]
MGDSKCECHMRIDAHPSASHTPEVSEASLPTEPEFKGANLCAECSAIRFNDGDPVYDGYRAVSETGEPIVKFDDDDREREWILNYKRSDTLPDLPNLQGSAKAGCGFCRLLVDAIHRLQIKSAGAIQISLQYMWKPDLETIPRRYGLKLLVARLLIHSESYEPEGLIGSFVTGCSCKKETGCCCLLTTLVFVVESGLGTCASWPLTLWPGTCASWLRLPDKTTEETLCDENVKMMKAELARSDEDRSHLGTTGFRPTRLLDLEVDSTIDSIKLIESHALVLEKPLRYATLSYCWGSASDASAALTTNRGNVTQHLKNIPLENVPSTIQDAISVARSLSLRYLWIDALCIIQGDLRDWETESELMGLVFGNAYVTFCASASASCREGFLRRPSSVEIGFRSTVDPDVQGTYHLRHHRTARGVWEHGGDPLVLDLAFQEWGYRAWILQEAQLSHRMLIFGISRVYFACAARTVIEESFNNYHETGPLRGFFFTENSRLINQDGGKFVKDGWYNMWIDLIEKYAGRKLTNPQDKLPAISGMAKIIADSVGDTYLAGLWEGDLVRGLLWNVTTPRYRGLPALLMQLKLTTTESASYVAPTWSWASRDTAVSYFRLYTTDVCDYRPECSSVCAKTKQECAAQNIYGQIEDGQLAIKGKIALPTSDLMGMYLDQEDDGLWRVRFAKKGVATVDLDWRGSRAKGKLEHWIQLLLIASRLRDSSDENQNAGSDSGEVSGPDTEHRTRSSEQQSKSTGGVTKDLSRLSVGMKRWVQANALLSSMMEIWTEEGIRKSTKTIVRIGERLDFYCILQKKVESTFELACLIVRLKTEGWRPLMIVPLEV